MISTENGSYFIELFGELRVVLPDGQATTRFRTHKAASLFAYLAQHPHTAHAREQLTELFWSDLEPEAARDNLSTALSSLRRQLEPPPLPSGTLFQTDRQTVRLQSERVSTDTARWEALLKAAGRTGEAGEKARLLQEALTLYRGEFLPGHYDDWVTREQTRYAELHLNALLQLSEALEETGDREGALRAAQQAGQTDPYLEEAVECQMRLLLQMGRPSSALDIYQVLAKFLKEQIGASPEPRLRQLAEQIKQDPKAVIPTQKGTAKKPTSVVSTSKAVSGGEPAVSPALPPTNLVPDLPLLPVTLTRFFGREQERERLSELLLDSGNRLITLLGPGGTGKTRFSLEVARQVAPHFGNRVVFVSLAEIPGAGLIPSALVTSLRLGPKPGTDPIERIVEALGGERCLFILDNMEHLLGEIGALKGDGPSVGGASALVRLLLGRLPGLTCLVTSRISLRIGGEQLYPLAPLALPSSLLSLEELLKNDSIALYVDRARLALPDFALTANNQEAVVSLCQKLEGMPLAIEMAAAWAKLLPPVKMLERMQKQLDLLVSRRRDLPPRHQSLRATIEWSYDLLVPDLQRLFARLSIFRGGWTLEMAEAVCGEDALFGMEELADHSLIVAQELPGGIVRYRMLETLREFAGEKLDEFGEVASFRQKMAVVYSTWIEDNFPRMNGPDQGKWMDTLESENDNLRVVTAWCLEYEGAVLLGLSLPWYIWRFWQLRDHYLEGITFVKAILAHPAAQARTLERARAHHCAHVLGYYVGDYTTSFRELKESLSIAEEINDDRMMALVYNELGVLYQEINDNQASMECYEKSLAINRKENAEREMAVNLSNMGVVAKFTGDLATAQRQFEEALAIQKRIGDKRSVCIALNNLGDVHQQCGNLETAEACHLESLRVDADVGNKRCCAYVLESLGHLAVERGDPLKAGLLYGVAEKVRESIQAPLAPSERGNYDQWVARAREACDPQAFASAWAEGKTWTLEQAKTYLLT